MWDKSGKVIKIPFAVKVGMECMYLKPIKRRPFGLGMSYLPKITIINIHNLVLKGSVKGQHR